MSTIRRTIWLVLGCILMLGASTGSAQDKKVEKKKAKPATQVWTDPHDPKLPDDFKFQGEFANDKVGAQVIALGNGAFQVVVLPCGLPGAGWDGKNKSLLEGTLSDGKVLLRAVTGKRQYLANPADLFSATAKFPPTGQGNYQGVLLADRLEITEPDGKSHILARTQRTSPTLNEKAPPGALVLFDGSKTDEWKGGRLDSATKWLNTDGNNITSKRSFNNYLIHLEFMLPFRPEARGQGRGNSGFYQVNHYEVQILDSFGLDGKNNECGGVYSQIEPKLNMCLPPLSWQTYDIEFTNAVNDASGKKIKNARLTARLNGVVIHNDVEIKSPSGGHRNDPEGTPGPLLLQGHGNPLQFRNIWIVER